VTWAQVFTAGLTGQLTSVDVKIDRGPSATLGLSVDLWSTSGGAPSASLASVLVPSRPAELAVRGSSRGSVDVRATGQRPSGRRLGDRQLDGRIRVRKIQRRD
jgi:hypothetical protein